MALPIPPNVSCVIYRHSNSPPSDPDVGSVAGFLQGAFEHREGLVRFTHILLLDGSLDIRDDYNHGEIGTQGDVVYVPDAEGVPFRVQFVERQGRGTPQDHKRVYLDRFLPTWPSNEL